MTAEQTVARAPAGALHRAVRDAAGSVPGVALWRAGDPAPSSGPVVAVEAGADPQLRHRWNEWSRATGTALLPVGVEPGAVVIGPTVLPTDGDAGCLECARGRRLRARDDIAGFAQMLDRFPVEYATAGARLLTPFAVEVTGRLVEAEARAVLSAPSRMRTRNALLRLGTTDLRTTVHPFLPDPLCAACGRVPDDTAERAVIRLRSRPTAGRGRYRVRSLVPERDRLASLYVDDDAGLLRAVHKDGRSVLPAASAPMGLRATHRTERGFGRQLDYRGTSLTAITEGIERYAGIEPGGKRTVVRGSYRELAADAVDPTGFGLHSDEQYARPGFHYPRYHHDMVFNWVWAHSFAAGRAVLVPENYAYYGTVYRNTRDHPFVYEISNGCALGGCLEEAVLHGVLEVAERDAFLMTWYARLPAPRLDPDSARDRRVPLIIEGIADATGYSVEVHDITVEHGVPCVWVMAVDGHGRPDLPRVLCASGSHPDPESAVTNALLELAPLVSRPPEYYRANRGRVEAMLADPYAVTAMEDHALLGGAPEAFDRFDFLRSVPGRRSFADAFGERPARWATGDLTDTLRDVLERYLDRGLDVLVVDQTTPELRAGDFRCVKVIIPGMLPMTFGHHARRVTGFDRLRHVPRLLGYRDRPMDDAELNPYPHPFP